MKRLLFALFLIPVLSFGQRPVLTKITADTTKLTTVDNTGNEFVLENGTMDSSGTGVLTNVNRGRTQFKRLRLKKLNDTTYVAVLGTAVCGDTIHIKSTGGSGGSGGSQDLQSVTDIGASTTNDITVTTHKGAVVVGGGDPITQAKIVAGNNDFTSGYLQVINNTGLGDCILKMSNTANVGSHLNFPERDDIEYTIPITVNGISSDNTGNVILNDSIYRERLFADLYNEYSGSQLIKGSKYVVTDFESIYDEAGTEETKTGSTEAIVLTATSGSTFDTKVTSLNHPDDVIYYDISIIATYINSAACKGRIMYRESPDGQKADYDWRAVLMFNPFTSAEGGLTFQGTNNYHNQINYTYAFGTLPANDLEFPNLIIAGDAQDNQQISLAASVFDNTFKRNSNIQGGFNHVAGGFESNSTLHLNNSTFSDAFVQNTNLDIQECTVVEAVEFNTGCVWNNTTFGDQITKATNANFNNSVIGGKIDRLTNVAVLNSFADGWLYWGIGFYIDNSVVEGDIKGCNLFSMHADTVTNASLDNICGTSHQGEVCGFKGCHISAGTTSDRMSNIHIDCMVTGKIITKALYPELFDSAYNKTIYKTPNGNVWYRYLDDSNTWQFVEII